MLEYQLSHIYETKPDLFYLFPDVVSLWNAVTIMLALPIMNFVILPCIPTSTMRERIGFGVALIILSAVLATYIDWCVLPDVSRENNKFLWLALPTVCVSLGEVMLFVNGKILCGHAYDSDMCFNWQPLCVHVHAVCVCLCVSVCKACIYTCTLQL